MAVVVIFVVIIIIVVVVITVVVVIIITTTTTTTITIVISAPDVFVELMAGYHYMTSTLRFHVPHNGTVVFRAYQGQEVHVVGGQPIPSSLFHHVTDTHVLQRLPLEARGKVLELDLTGAGIQDLGTLTTYGFYHLWKAPLEIFINGRPLKLAQWPNDSLGTYVIVEVRAFSPGVDPHTHTITLAKDSQYGLRVGHYTPTGPQVGNALQGGYFRVINMLCEIDQPGNDHVIEYNHVHHMCWNASDCGALHTGRQWTWRGNVVRYNYIHHTLRYMPGADVRGIMLDDEYSSALIEHNVFFDNEVHVNIGGGRDNVIRYNVMYNATKYSIQVDARGMECWFVIDHCPQHPNAEGTYKENTGTQAASETHHYSVQWVLGAARED
nr:hypothetical protein BaRGS_034276 [Batillaria attramentaria]